MSRRKRILVADLLCGAGGSSTGCARALADLGLEMDLVCVNHWPVAIETHQKNHPQARHYVQDIATVRPHLLVPEGYLDLLMASPTCTHHSVARGGKPTSDQQRSDPWHIVTWLTELRVKRIIIENVWEFCGWGPVDPRTSRPIKSKKGVYFHQWISTLKGLGYELEWRKLNAANYGDATTRQRFILKGRNDKKILGWAPITHTKRTDDNLLSFAQLKPWRPARDIIDWNIRGKSIFGRKKALAPKTLARIYAGAVKHKWPDPFIVVLRNHMAAQGIDAPLPTIAASGLHIGIAQPVVVNMKGQSTATGVDDPLPTQTAHAAHIYAAEPVIMNGRKGNQAKAVSTDPVPTLDTKGGVWLAQPIKHHPLCSVHNGSACDYDCARDYPQALILSQQNSGAPRSVEDPVPTITTGGAGVEKRQGCARPMLVEPFILNRHGDGYGETRAHSIEEPTPTANCDGGGYLVEPFVLSQASGGSPRAVSDPLPTSTTGGAGGAHALISAYYGANSTCSSDADPLPTVTTKDRFGIVIPVTHSQSDNNGRSVEEPIPTITTAKGGEFAVVMPVTHAGGHDRVQGVDEPIPTVTGANRGEQAIAQGIVTPVFDGAQYDILFRMLEPHELAAAMGFTTEDHPYEFAGTKTEQIKQIGNAVSVAMMKAEVKAIMADAAAVQPTSKAQRSAAA